MELLGLQMRIKKGISDPKEIKEVKKRIKALEKELEMD
jgi:tetrahydromethanopterin S-methyltransferase subunit G